MIENTSILNELEQLKKESLPNMMKKESENEPKESFIDL